MKEKVEPKITEVTGTKDDPYYRKYYMPSYMDCSVEEERIFQVRAKRDPENDIPLYLYKIKLEDGGYFFKVSSSNNNNILSTIFSETAYFASEDNALARIEKVLLHHKNNK